MPKPYPQGKSPRQKAIREGKRNYFSNRPCPKGHVGMVRVFGGCLECINLARPEANIRRLKKDPLIFSYVGAKKRAKQLGIEFSITKKDIAISVKCPLLGMKLVYGNLVARKDNSASIDRIDNSKGYIKGNVWIISDKANRIKRDSSFKEFEKMYVAWKRML